MSNKKGLFLFLMAFIFAGAMAQAATLIPTYRSSITPGGAGGGLGTIKSGGSSVTITPTSILAVSDSATTESVGSITWTSSVIPMTVTLTFNYQITSPGGFVIWGAGWFGGTFEYTDGTAKTFSQTFDIEDDQIFVSVKAKGGSVSINNISVP
jgi:hypothetical protein